MAPQESIITEAISKHNELADSLFVDGHDALANEDVFASPFTYGRWRIRLQLMNALAQQGKGQRLLDIGCGVGEELSLYHKLGYEVEGVEPAAEMRRLASERHPEIADRIHEGSIYALPLEDRQFDVVLSIEVVRYLEDVVAAGREISRVLKSGGRWIFTVTPPTNWTMGPALNAVRMTGIPVPGVQRLKQFWHSARMLNTALPEAGLRITHLVPIYYLDFLSLALQDISPAMSSSWMRLWHPLWQAMEHRRCMPWAAGYYFVIAEAVNQ